MKEYNFTLIIQGDAESKMDELYKAGCDDCTFATVDGVHYGKFEREAASFAEAVSSAIAAVESVEGLAVLRTVETKARRSLPTNEDRAWMESDLSHLGEYEPYEWAKGELEEGIPVRYEAGRGLRVEGDKRRA